LLVTVVTKYDEDMSEHFVTVIEGKINEDDRAILREKYDCPAKGVDEPDSNYMYFREMPVRPLNESKCLYNINGEQ
jgi:hypothetical protein